MIRAEDRSGLRWTPTYTVGGETRPCWWNPQVCPGGMIPRGEVNAALEQLFKRFRVVRFYCDPREWDTEIDNWTLEYGEDRVVKWYTTQIKQMNDALTRYKVDMIQGATQHLYLPEKKRKSRTEQVDDFYEDHALNARMIAKPGDRYILGKPSEHQHIDLCMADVLAHEAAADARATGWPTDKTHPLSAGPDPLRRWLWPF